MPDKKVRLRIVTPTEMKVDEDADMIIMRCTSGDMGVLFGHEPYAAVLDYGILRIFNGGDERKIAVFGGLAEVKNDVLTVLANGAEWPEDIDRSRAELDRQRAEQRLREHASAVEIQNAQVMLRRSLVRIEISAYPLINDSDQRNRQGEED